MSRPAGKAVLTEKGWVVADEATEKKAAAVVAAAGAGILTVDDIPLDLAKRRVEMEGLLVVTAEELSKTSVADTGFQDEGDMLTAIRPKTAAEMIEIVKAADSIKQLTALLEGEARVTVLRAAEERAAELKAQEAQ